MEPEEDLFSSGGRGKGALNSKLSNIFAQDTDWSTAGNSALAYKQTKATPKGGALPPSVAAASANAQAPSDNKGALFASMVSLISYDAARHGTVVGPRALALMRHPSGSVLLLAYEPSRPNQPDVMVTVNENFTLMPQAPSYAFFYDDARNYWCVQLATPDALTDFARLVGLAKHAANPSGVSVVTQDLLINAAEPRAISNGDAVKVRYNLHLLSPQHPRELGPLLSVVGTEDKPKQIKLGANKELVGLEQGLVGMKKGGKRVLILPASLAYGAAGNASLGVPANTPVLLEVELLRVKHADKPQAQLMASTPSATASPAAKRPSVIVLGGPAEGPSTPGDSSNESSEKPDSRRNSIASRMAAMGGFAMPGRTPVGLPAATAPTPEGQEHSHAQQTQSQQQPQQPVQQQPSQQQQQQPLQQAQHQPQQQFQQPQQQQQQSFQQPQQQQPMQQQPVHTQYPQQPALGQQQTFQQSYQQTQPVQPQQQPYGQYPAITSPTHYGQPQQQPQHPAAGYSNGYPPHGFVPGGVNPLGAPSVPLHTLEAKLDAIQSQLSRCLGSGHAYDPNPTLNGAQMLRGLTALITERDEVKEKEKKSADQVAELTAKISSLHERNESYLAENQKLSEARFQNFSEELKLKNASITQLQEANRQMQHDVQARVASAQEAELKAQKLSMELEMAQAQVKNQRELERQVTLLTIQLEEAKKSTEHSTESVRVSMGQQLVTLQQEALERANDIKEMQAKHATQLAEAAAATEKEATKAKQLQATIDGLERELASARNDVEAGQSTVQQHAGEVKQLQLRLEHATQELHEARTQRQTALEAAAAEHAALKKAHETTVASEQALLAKVDQLQAALEGSGSKDELAAALAASDAQHQAQLAAMQAQLAQQSEESAAALAVAVEAALEQGKSDAADVYRPKLDEVVTKAKLKIESVTAELEEAVAARTELEAQVAALTEEKDAIVEQSKAVIAKIRVQVQAQQQEHEASLQAAVQAASEHAAGAGGVAAEEVERVWQERVKKAMSSLFQTLAASLARSTQERFSRAQLRNLIMRDIKNVTVRSLNGEEGPAPVSEEEAAAEAAEAAEIAAADAAAAAAAASSAASSAAQSSGAPGGPAPSPEADAPAAAVPSHTPEAPAEAKSSSAAASAAADDFGPDEDQQSAVESAAASSSAADAAPEKPVEPEAATAPEEPVAATASSSHVEPVVVPAPVEAEPAASVSSTPIVVEAAESKLDDAPATRSSSNSVSDTKKKLNKKQKAKAKKKAAAASAAEAKEDADDEEPAPEASPVAKDEPATPVDEPVTPAAEPVAAASASEEASAPAEPAPEAQPEPAELAPSAASSAALDSVEDDVSAPSFVDEPASSSSEPQTVVSHSEDDFEFVGGRGRSSAVEAPTQPALTVAAAAAALEEPAPMPVVAAPAPIVSPSTATTSSSISKPKFHDPFADDDEPVFSSKPAAPAAAAVAPAVAAKKPTASSLFGDDDDDDLFPAPKPAAVKPTVAKKSSLFDDDD